MNFSGWSASCFFRIAGATPNTTLREAASTSRAISSVPLKWCQYTIWSFWRLPFMIHKHSFAVLACCFSAVDDHRITDLSHQSTNPGKHLCLLITTCVLSHPDVVQACLSHRDTINSLHIPFQIFILPVRESRF